MDIRFWGQGVPETLDQYELLKRLTEVLERIPDEGRFVVAIAGAPASGKSTLAEWLVDKLNTQSAGVSAILPMDGYHYDDEVLVPNGWREQKGAPHTFDVAGLRATLQRLQDNTEPTIAVPRFDRDLEIARAGAVLIKKSVQLIIVEGNYLLLNEEPWRQLAILFDLEVLVKVGEAELEKRLRNRWEGYGLSDEDIYSKVFENDLPNGRLVESKSVVPNVFVEF